MKNLLITSILSGFIILQSCAKHETFKELPQGPINHHLIVLAKIKDGVRARGFSGATPAGTEVFCEVGKINSGKVTSNGDGSFTVDLANTDPSIKHGEFTFTINRKPYQQGYEIKDLSKTALAHIAKDAFATEKEVDSISFFGDQVAILSSDAALLSTFAVDHHWSLAKQPTKAILLNQSNPEALGARMVHVRGAHAVVPLFAKSELLLVDLTKESVDKVRLRDKADKLYLFNVTPPLTVQNPIDADDSGHASTTISRTAAQNAEAVFAVDDHHYLASFVNYYQNADPSKGTQSVVGPGLVALLFLKDDKLTTLDVKTMPYKNPSYFVPKDDLTIWVSCSGPWANDGSGVLKSSDAGLVRLKIAADLTSFSIDHRIPLNDFSPAEPALVDTKLIIPHLLSNEIAVIDEAAVALFDADRKKPIYHREFNFTFATHWHDDIVFLGDNQGTLVAYSLSESYFPFPFTEPIKLNPDIDPKVPSGPQKLLFRHKVEKIDPKTDYPTGYNAWVISAIQQKIIPLDFLAVFGP